MQYIFQYAHSPSCIKVRASWDMTPNILVDVYWRFEGISCYNLQGRRMGQQVRTKRSHVPRYTTSHTKTPYDYFEYAGGNFMKLRPPSLPSRTLPCISNFFPQFCLRFKNFSWVNEQPIDSTKWVVIYDIKTSYIHYFYARNVYTKRIWGLGRVYWSQMPADHNKTNE